MTKRINSEYSINNISNFNITLGTSNKKRPEVIYATLTSYVIPTNEEVDELFFDKLNKSLKQYVKNIIQENNFCERDVIVIVDIANNRLSYSKPSYLDIQIYFKPKIETIIAHNNNFKTISEQIYHDYIVDIVKYASKLIANNGFLISKTKTIYTEI
jgi:hypothetical protein